MKKYKQPFQIELLREFLEYSHETGELIWKNRRISAFSTVKSSRTWNTRFSEKAALTTLQNSGYRGGSFCGKTLLAHRICWAIYYGKWPNKEIDHINRDKTDNRISNLRMATRSQNAINKQKPENNSSGFKGVVWCKKDKKWTSKIGKDGKSVGLGRFNDKTVAARAYDTAAHKLYGEYAVLNFPEAQAA